MDLKTAFSRKSPQALPALKLFDLLVYCLYVAVSVTLLGEDPSTNVTTEPDPTSHQVEDPWL